MTQEEKDLLLKDLCARLPYGVKCYGITKDRDEDGNYIDKKVTDILYELHSYKCCYGLVGLMNECNIESIKPYLRPMSSMTEEEREELEHLSDEYFGKALDKQIQESLLSSNKNESRILEYIASSIIVDWLNARHFDYRGLIEKGLAFEAPEGMYN